MSRDQTHLRSNLANHLSNIDPPVEVVGSILCYQFFLSAKDAGSITKHSNVTKYKSAVDRE